MKKSLLLIAVSLLIAIASFSQTEFTLPVKEVNLSDTAFNYHPVSLHVRFKSYLTNSWDTSLYSVDITYNPAFDTATGIVSKITRTTLIVKLPNTVVREGIKPNGTVTDVNIINAILSVFKLELNQE